MRHLLRVQTVLALGVLLASWPKPSSAATISVGPTDSYTKIEGANPGDEVVIAPGTYKFRVYLTKQAPASQPIIIRAQDPNNPPVWDLTGTLVEDAPGSYTAGDRGRGCWQISGGTNYQISDLIIQGCRTSTFDSAGLRYYEGTKGILLSNIVFKDNDNGLTGGSQDSEIVVEFSEFDHNGNTSASSSSPTHNMYIYGGNFTLRYSYVHDSAQAQNFHIRAQTAVLEYNWFARATNYEGDLMADDDYSGGATFSQSMVLRGNVFLQAASPSNDGQIVAVYNDTGVSGLTLGVTLVNNTLVGNGGHAALVHLSNADGTPMTAELDNNIVSGTSVVTLIEDASKGTVSGTHNWLQTGAPAGSLAASIVSGAPGFKNPAGKDFTLATGSACIGKASTSVSGLPDEEYYENEVVARMYRVRTAVNDLGAFDTSTTGPGIGPHSAAPTDAGAPVDAAPDSPADSSSGPHGHDAGSPPKADAGSKDGGSTPGTPGSSGSAPSGCGCTLGSHGAPSRETFAVGLVGMLLFGRRRKR